MKLYLVVRYDLSSAGMQAAQLCHALRAFSEEHPDHDRSWFERSNTLVCLKVPNEESLMQLHNRVRARDVPASLFREPDLNGQATALAVGPMGRRICSTLDLL